jgi:creatinine amidohydrolase
MLIPLNRMSWRQVRDAEPQKMWLVLPVSALEQHGLHLPLGTDDLILQKMLDALVDNPELEENYYLLPSIHYGESAEHMSFPGTVALSPSTLLAVLDDMVRAMAAHGFKHLVLLSSHGGNTHLLQSRSQKIRQDQQIKSYNIDFYGSGFYDEAARFLQTPLENDIHAGEIETSFMLYAYPDYVDREAWKKQRDVLVTLPRYGNFWISRDYGESGLMGGASRASAETGEKIFTYMLDKLLEIFRELRRDTEKVFP